jgi:hypothetical protein
MIRILFAFAFLFLFSCTHPARKYQPGIAEIKSFFAKVDDSILTKRSFLLVDTVKAKWKDLFVSTASYQKALPDDDIDFISKQLDQTTPAVWTNSMFDSARIVSSSYIAAFQKRTGLTPVHYTFSFPYFSKDKKYCVLYYDNYCGNLCAEQSLRLYKYENGRWTVVKTLFSIVS